MRLIDLDDASNWIETGPSADGPSSGLSRGRWVRNVFDQAGQEADQFLVGRDPDPFVHPVDPLQVVVREAKREEAVDVRRDRGVIPRIGRDHREAGVTTTPG